MKELNPILLNADQHAQLKSQLAMLLEKEYSITNQTSGKLEYIAACLMGFNNHHHRKHALNIAHAQGCHPNMLVPQKTQKRQWPGPWLPKNNGQLTTEQEEWLIGRGWWFHETDGDEYVDVEIEFTYAKEDGLQSRKSFNAQMSFCFESKSIRFSVGDNLGDGFNEYVWWSLDSSTPALNRDAIKNNLLSLVLEKPADGILNLQKKADSDFAKTFFEHSEVSDKLLDELHTIHEWLYGTKLL